MFHLGQTINEFLRLTEAQNLGYSIGWGLLKPQEKKWKQSVTTHGLRQRGRYENF